MYYRNNWDTSKIYKFKFYVKATVIVEKNAWPTRTLRPKSIAKGENPKNYKKIESPLKVEEFKEKKSKTKDKRNDEKTKWNLDTKKIVNRIEYLLINYYDRYIPNEKKMIEDLVINYLLIFKKSSIEIEGSIPDEIFNKLDMQ